RHGMRAARRVASGGIHGLHVTAREPLRIALREAASAFVLVHNHPSGDPTPSDEDLAFTRAVVEAAAAVGMPMLDHVVVARRRATSMLDAGLLGLLPPARAKPLGRA
ncbi:MAG TPA: JAB domain-containing protein, partial [Polyangiaceae bacterium]